MQRLIKQRFWIFGSLYMTVILPQRGIDTRLKISTFAHSVFMAKKAYVCAMKMAAYFLDLFINMFLILSSMLLI